MPQPKFFNQRAVKPKRNAAALENALARAIIQDAVKRKLRGAPVRLIVAGFAEPVDFTGACSTNHGAVIHGGGLTHHVRLTAVQGVSLPDVREAFIAS